MLVGILSDQPIRDLNVPSQPRSFPTQREALSVIGLINHAIHRDLWSDPAGAANISTVVWDYTIRK